MSTLADAKALLDELVQEVNAEEGVLSAARHAGGVNGAKLAALQKTQCHFGNPRNHLLRLTEQRFADLSLELTPIYKAQLAGTFDFYYLTLNVNFEPGPGVQFSRVTAR